MRRSGFVVERGLPRSLKKCSMQLIDQTVFCSPVIIIPTSNPIYFPKKSLAQCPITTIVLLEW